MTVPSEVADVVAECCPVCGDELDISQPVSEDPCLLVGGCECGERWIIHTTDARSVLVRIRTRAEVLGRDGPHGPPW